MAGIATAIVGVLIGLPTLRLRGDYLAIVTLGFGEILPQIARNGDNLFGTGFNLTNGTGGITPIDGPGFGNWAHAHLDLPAQYLNGRNFDAVFFWTALVLVVLTAFCSARLRDSRIGRAWIAIREDETAAAAMGVPLDADEDVVLCDGRVLRRRCGCVLRVATRAARSRTTSSSRSPSSSCAWSFSAAWATSGASSSARASLRISIARAFPTSATRSTRISDQHLSPEVRIRHLRRDHRDRHALPAGGVDPELAGRGGAA